MRVTGYKTNMLRRGQHCRAQLRRAGLKESMFMPAEGRKSKCRDPDLSKPHKYSTVAILKGFLSLFFFIDAPGAQKNMRVCVHVCSFDATAYVIKTKLVYL